MEEIYTYTGDAVKKTDDDKIGGYLVRFTDADNPDIDGDFFTKNTQFGELGKTPIWLNHRLPMKTRNGGIIRVREQIGEGRLVRDDNGVLIKDAILYNRELYNDLLDHLGWSSGTATHLVDTKMVKDKREILTWPLGLDASLTPFQAEPKNNVLRIKSIQTEINPTLDQSATADQDSGADDDGKVKNSTIEIVESEQMSDEKETVETNPLQEQLDALSTKMASLVELVENAAPLRDAGYVAPDDEAGKPEVKSLGDFAVAIARGNTKRLQTVYGSVKAHDSLTGESLGYAVPEGFVLDINKQINLNSGIAALVDPQPVGQPSGRMPVPDYSVVPTAGSGDTADAAGVGVNARSEGGAYTEETGKLEQLQWRVTDALSGYVKASKELSQYAPAIEGLLRRYIATAQGAKKEYFILRGNGVGQPLGILNWAGAVAHTPATNNVFAVADADVMLSRFLQSGSQPVWIIHPGIIPDIAQMERGTGAGAFQSNIAQSLSTTLHGFPIVRSQHLPQDDNSGCVILADLSMYTMFEYGSMYLDFSEHADFLNGNNVWRFGQLVDGKPSMTAAVTLADPQGSYTLSPFVYLND